MSLQVIAEYKLSRETLKSPNPARWIHRYVEAGADMISVVDDRRSSPRLVLTQLIKAAEIARRSGTPILIKPLFRGPPMPEYYSMVASMGYDACLFIPSRQSVEDVGSILASGMKVFMEIHEEEEVAQTDHVHHDFLVINRRDLKTGEVDEDLFSRLHARVVPDGTPVVAASGISSAEEARELRAGGADAVLVGSWLMEDIDLAAKKIKEMKSGDG